MKGIKNWRLGLAAVAAAVLAIGAGLVATSQVSAQAPTVSVSDGNAAPGGQGDVTVDVSDVGSPGLGAWTVDIEYDVTVATAVACAPEHGGVCNTRFDTGVVRVTGASATGILGDTTLATITFRCEVEGDSSLSPTISVLADATIGDPQDIDADTSDGSFTCGEVAPPPPPPPPPPAASPTPQLPTVGTGGDSSSGGSLNWLVAALAAVGLAGIAGYSALRVRARR